MENWILTKDKKGEIVKVRQRNVFTDEFIGENGVVYNVADLDFTEMRLPFPDLNKENKENLDALKDMMKSMDAKAIADHQAGISEREYWRKLRGEIFMEMYRNYLATGNWMKSEDDLLNKTKYLVNQLWQQDRDFISDK